MNLVPFAKSHTPSHYRTGFEDIDRVFDNFFRNALTNMSGPASSVTDLAVRMNVSETEKAYHVTADLPGVDEKDIELTVSDGLLTLSGEKVEEHEEEGKAFHRVERSYGQFQRALQLPADADENKIKADMKNGVLEIEIGKVKEARKEPRRIDIKKS